MAELTAKVEGVESELEGKIAPIKGSVATTKADLTALQDGVATPVQGWIGKIAAVKSKLDARFQALNAELDAMV